MNPAPADVLPITSAEIQIQCDIGLDEFLEKLDAPRPSPTDPKQPTLR